MGLVCQRPKSLPACLASHGISFPFPDEPVSQIDADVPLEPIPLHADAADFDLDLHSYERPLAAAPFGAVEHVPDWEDTRAMTTQARPKSRELQCGSRMTLKPAPFRD